jgi:hypothetical protein
VELEQHDGPIGEIPLDAEQAAAIARLLDTTVKPSRLDYFLETTVAKHAQSR